MLLAALKYVVSWQECFDKLQLIDERHPFLMQKWCGVIDWRNEDGFTARVVTCAHKRRLHMMDIDEDFQEAELILTFAFENPRFTEADFTRLCEVG